MSIAQYVCDAIDKTEAGNFEMAMSQVCIAIDATAKKECPAIQNNVQYKDFLKRNLVLISYFGLPTVFPDVQLSGCSLEHILYKLVRCGLLHEATMEKVELSSTVALGAAGDSFVIGRGIVYGLIFTVVLAKSNAQQSGPDHYWLGIDGVQYKLNDLWGKRDVIASYVDMRRSGQRYTLAQFLTDFSTQVIDTNAV